VETPSEVEGTAMTDFFISYTGVDRSWAEWIAWQLEAAGYTTVIQAWDFRPGANFAVAMQRTAAESERTIAVLSPAYLQSGFTAAEWAAAFARDPTGAQGLLLPVRIHDCEPRGLLPQIVYIDLVGLDAKVARDTLLAGVQRQRAKPTREPGFPGFSPRSVTVPPLFPGTLPPNIPFLGAGHFVGRQAADEQFRLNRRQMLEKVRLIWIKGFLEPSLDQLAHIELGLETRPDAVARPFDLLVQRPAQAPQPLPTGIPISHVFDEARNALLILGEPGAGKTTLLLELTRDLLDRAKQDERHLIPVVFHLSSWAEQRLSLAAWLIDELRKRYDVPRTLAKMWVDDGLILPLLDGLDEVAADHREACVTTINGFVHEHGLVPLVVCSRRAEYEALSVHLRLPSAVIIQSLTRQQVQNYIDQAGASLAGLRTVLQDDEHLWELLNTPLMLSIMALAYQGRSVEEIHAASTLEGSRSHIFAAYTDAMFRRGAPTTLYTRKQTEHWLTWLAKAMKDHSQTVFYLEWMQPDWLPGRWQQRLVAFIMSVMNGLLFGLVFGLGGWWGGGFGGGLVFGLFGGVVGVLGARIQNLLIGGLLFGLLGGLAGGLGGGLLYYRALEIGAAQFYSLADRLVDGREGLVAGMGVGLLGGLIGSLGGYSKEIKPVEKLQWSWSAARHKWINKLFKRLGFGLLGGLVFGLVFGLLGGLGNQLVFRLLGGLLFGLLGGILFGLLGGLGDGFTVGEIGSQSFPNEGIKRSIRKALICGLLGGLLFGLGGGLLFGLGGGLLGGLEGGLLFGLLGGLGGGLRFGGRACLHHFALRLVLWQKNFAPLKYIRFLDYATARIFLRKVGGGYVFVHRMLLEYFAARQQISVEQQSQAAKLQP